ncbi:LysM peptidoglycan-binding domain-containing protein [Microbacterium sp. SLBN-111]|uniref:LysM peptidoglycan-binding domain-containing protein n=1 Tax=Microbacterium sp. SLBN-111 TaxID=3377733 RepID=UPI003C75858C
MGTVRTTTTLAIGILVVGLTGCTPTAEPSAESTPAASASASAADSGAAAPAVATPAGCDPATSTHPIADPGDPEQLGGRSLAVPHDGGVTAMASGEAILNGDGVPVAYRVASGDAIFTIAARFCLTEDWLDLINHARRDNAGLYPGDTLNLDAHTIFSVGDENGVVAHNTFTDGYKLPPQR